MVNFLSAECVCDVFYPSAIFAHRHGEAVSVGDYGNAATAGITVPYNTQNTMHWTWSNGQECECPHLSLSLARHHSSAASMGIWICELGWLLWHSFGKIWQTIEFPILQIHHLCCTRRFRWLCFQLFTHFSSIFSAPLFRLTLRMHSISMHISRLMRSFVRAILCVCSTFLQWWLRLLLFLRRWLFCRASSLGSMANWYTR